MKLQKMNQGIISILISISLVLILAGEVLACGPTRSIMFANDLLMIPFSLISSFYGIPFLLTVLTEAFILSKRENLSYLKSCGLTGLANVVYLVAIGFSLTFGLDIFPINLIGSAISAAIFLRFYQRTGYLKNLNKGVFTFLVYLFFIGLGIAQSFLTASLSVSTPIPNLYAATAGMIAIGFIMGFVMKGLAVYSFMKVKSPYFANTIMSMHVASYPIVAASFYLMKTLNLH
jgi:hypothetical protein